MKTRYISKILLALPLLASCSDKLEMPESGNGVYTIEANISSPQARTKVDLGAKADDVYPVLWEAKDVIGINTELVGLPTFSPYTLNNGVGEKKATFAGTKQPILYVNHKLYIASYPQTPDNVSVSGADNQVKMSYDIAASQTHDTGRNIAKGAFPMMGYGMNYYSLTFENLASVIRLDLEGDYTVTKIEIKPADSATGFAGSVNAVTSDTDLEPTFASVPTAGSSVTLDCSANPVTLTADNLTTFDFVVCPGTYKGGFVCTITKSTGETVTKNYTPDLDLKRSYLFEIGDNGYRFVVWLKNPYNSSDLSQTIDARDLLGSVSSFKVENGVKTGLAWTADWSIDGVNWNGGLPAGFEELNLSGPASTAIESTAFKLLARNSVTESDTDNRWIKALQAKGTASSTIDLSLRDYAGNTLSAVSTSNCYVVHQAGTYTFPTYYGNVEKGGEINTPAFSYTSSETSVSPEVSGTTTSIMNPFIGSDGTVLKVKDGKTAITSVTKTEDLKIANINSASVIWTDHDGLIASVKYNNNAITFTTCAATSIHSGNAVIAAKDKSGNILWSWHIWVTDQDLTETFTAKDGVKMLPCNLGWYSTGATIYEKQSVLVRYTQAESGRQVIIPIDRPEIVIPTGENTYYQWGRMNALAADCATTTSSDPLADIFKYPINAIKKSGSLTIYDPNGYVNRWNANNNIVYTGGNTPSATLIKTVYDPCPTGLLTPSGDAFISIASSYCELNGAGYLRDGDGNLHFFPVSTSGKYWTASPAYYGGTSGILSGLAFKVSGGKSYPMSYDNYAVDLGSIRPMVQ